MFYKLNIRNTYMWPYENMMRGHLSGFGMGPGVYNRGVKLMESP